MDVIGTSKGRGTTGAMKRHNFHGLPASHGVKKHHRSPGSIGSQASNRGSGRPKKGKRMAGRYGDERVTMRNLTHRPHRRRKPSHPGQGGRPRAQRRPGHDPADQQEEVSDCSAVGTSILACPLLGDKQGCLSLREPPVRTDKQGCLSLREPP